MVVDSFLRMKICVIGIKVIAQNKGGLCFGASGYGFRSTNANSLQTKTKNKNNILFIYFFFII